MGAWAGVSDRRCWVVEGGDMLTGRWAVEVWGRECMRRHVGVDEECALSGLAAGRVREESAVRVLAHVRCWFADGGGGCGEPQAVGAGVYCEMGRLQAGWQLS